MIGNKVMIRVRMSEKDCPYPEGLINGAHLMDVWGDVASELLVRIDGDEGWFRTYEHIDFLAPVYAGDYIEYYGWIEEAGNSSRRMVFEAYKVLELCKGEDGLPASAGRVLKEPLLVGRAEGICVTPKDLQRGPEDEAFAH